MISSSHSFQSVSIRKAILTLSILFVFSGCALVDNERNNQLSRNRGNSDKQVQNSTDYMLFPSDYVKFRSGRSKEEILKEINWKGDFIEASLYKGKSISAICFGLFESSLSREGELVWALFEDHKFKKFVRYPPSDGKLIKIGEIIASSLKHSKASQ